MREMCEMCESKTLDLGEAGTDERVCSGKCQIWPVLSKRLHDFERALAAIFKCMHHSLATKGNGVCRMLIIIIVRG